MDTEINEAAMTTLVAMSQVPDKFSATEIKNFYENILAKLPCIVFWKDKDFKYVFCNEITAIDFLKWSSPGEIVGKTDFDFGWELETVKWVRQTDEKILRTRKPLLDIEKIIRWSDGRVVHLSVNRMPLFDSAGEVIGIIGISVDITAQKEAEQREAELLRLEREHQQAVLQEKEKLITLAHKVAHDISSPLSALNMMMHACNELPESKRIVLKRAIESTFDIANNLLSTYRNKDQQAELETEQRQPLLISDFLIQLLSEKKVQYSNHAIRFETIIADEAQFAFAEMQAAQFRRAVSNLINNAVDALENKEDGVVSIQLTASAESITVAIQDNGKGMPTSMIEKMLKRQSFTEGKQHGHGLGLQQVWDTLDHNHGVMCVESTPGNGTFIHLTFPRIEAPDWIAQQIHLASDTIVVILDDEESIHGAWDTRLALYVKLYPSLDVHHFKQGRDALAFLATLPSTDKARVVLLSDYELLRQPKNGLQIIEESGIKNTVLVTSYYANPQVRDKAIGLNVKILPKQMASIVPIEVM